MMLQKINDKAILALLRSMLLRPIPSEFFRKLEEK